MVSNVKNRNKFFSTKKKEDGVHKFSKCSRYAVDWKQVLNKTDEFDIRPNSSWPIEYCHDGWEYKKVLVTSTIVIDVS